MKNQKKIKLDLIYNAFENYKVILKFLNSDKRIVSMVGLQYLPFLSLNLLDIIKKFDYEQDANDRYPQNIMSFSKLMKENRLLIKQETDANNYNIIKKNNLRFLDDNYKHLIKDYNRFQNLIIKTFGQKDYCVYSFMGIPFFNNIQQMRFIEIFETNSENKKSDLIQITSSMANFLQKFLSMHSNIEDFNPTYTESIYGSEMNFDMNDYYVYDEARSDLFKNNLRVDQNIFLFNLVCAVNSANYLYPEVIGLSGTALLRYKYITYLILVKGLWLYNKKFNSLNKNLKSIVDKSNSIFKNENNRRQFRNNLFHFDLADDADFEESLIHSLVNYHLDINIEYFDSVVTDSSNIYVFEANKMLFNEQKQFIGTNC